MAQDAKGDSVGFIADRTGARCVGFGRSIKVGPKHARRREWRLFGCTTELITEGLVNGARGVTATVEAHFELHPLPAKVGTGPDFTFSNIQIQSCSGIDCPISSATPLDAGAMYEHGAWSDPDYVTFQRGRQG
jgi:hypothetical protein